MTEPKTYKIATKEWGVTANEAAEILISAEDIKLHHPKLLEAARKVITEKQVATKAAVKKI